MTTAPAATPTPAPAFDPDAPTWRPDDPGIRGGSADRAAVRHTVDTGLIPFAAAAPLQVRLIGQGCTELVGTVRRLSAGVVLLEAGATPAGPAPVTVRAEWRVPCVDATAYWTPATDGSRWLPPSWTPLRTVSPTLGAPVAALVGAGDRNLCTAALGETGAPVRVGAGVVEETGEFAFTVEQQLPPGGPPLQLRLDLSGRHFASALVGVTDWWAEGRSHPAIAPAARTPAYSTWYSLHQAVDADAVELQAGLAAELGCGAVIVDDGWQTGDRSRGYGHCGDWEPNPLAFPDLAAHVDRVHRLGLAYLLWYALPFIGRRNKAWDRFRDRVLREEEGLDAAVLDPRHPEVRDHLTDRVAKSVELWGMDGVKIDFLDRFAVADAPPAGPGADCDEVHEGVRRLLAELDTRLRRTRPDVIVEHRQPYTGPGMWPYASMVRATDCPLSPAENRQRTVDCRLTAGPLAVHSDMIMWHRAESPAGVAVQLINALFAIPQLSVDLTAQSTGQRAALRFWLGVIREQADTLQRGRLEPSRPDLGYPTVRAYDGRTTVIARYAPLPVPAPADDWRTLLVANADRDDQVLLTGDWPTRMNARVQDCRGATLTEGELEPTPGALRVTVPTGGLLTLTRMP
jgi:alpha-galactosidase